MGPPSSVFGFSAAWTWKPANLPGNLLAIIYFKLEIINPWEAQTGYIPGRQIIGSGHLAEHGVKAVLHPQHLQDASPGHLRVPLKEQSEVSTWC